MPEPLKTKPTQDPAASLDDSWGLVERVGSSTALKNSPRMQQLFRYLCQCALNAPGEPVSEQQVGVEVYGRPPGYGAEGDTIVRTQVSQLRKRLLQHFLSDGRNEPMVIEIPVGSYLPVFQPRKEPSQLRTEPLSRDVTAAAAAAPGVRARSSIAWVLVALLLLLCGGLAWQNSRLRTERTATAARSPYLDHLWKQLFDNDRPTTIVASDANIMFFSNWTDKPVSLDEYRSPSYPHEVLGKISNPDVKNVLAHFMFTYLTGSQDAFAATRLTQTADQHRIPLTITDARHFRGQSQGNAIFLGHRKANPWVELFDNQLNFIYEWDSKTGKGLLRNRKPKSGESETYQAGAGGNTYATVSYVSTPEGTVVIIGGSDMTGTDAGSHFLCDENALHQLHTALGVDLSHPLPHFEALLLARGAGNAAYDAQLIAVRVLDH